MPAGDPDRRKRSAVIQQLAGDQSRIPTAPVLGKLSHVTDQKREDVVVVPNTCGSAQRLGEEFGLPTCDPINSVTDDITSTGRHGNTRPVLFVPGAEGAGA